MKNIFLLFLLFPFAMGSVFAQSAQNLSIAKGRLFTTDGFKIPFSSLIGNGSDSFTFQKADASGHMTMPSSSILRIDQEVGNEAGKWAGWLGISGLVGSLLGVAQASNNAKSLGLEPNKSANAGIVVGLTVISAGIGALIGMGKKKYKSAWTSPKPSTGALPTPIGVQLYCSSPTGIGVGLRIGL